MCDNNSSVLQHYLNDKWENTLIEKIIWVSGVLLSTPVTHMIIFNQGMLLLSSKHFVFNWENVVYFLLDNTRRS